MVLKQRSELILIYIPYLDVVWFLMCVLIFIDLVYCTCVTCVKISLVSTNNINCMSLSLSVNFAMFSCFNLFETCSQYLMKIYVRLSNIATQDWESTRTLNIICFFIWMIYVTFSFVCINNHSLDKYSVNQSIYRFHGDPS